MFFVSGKEVLKRWKNLRDSFAKSEKKMKECKASGSKATKKRKYIFTNEMQFLKKVYTGREVTDSHDNEECVIEDGKDNDKDKIDPPAASEKRAPTTRKHKKMDEVDIKIIQALNTPKEKSNSSMLFFESLLPMIENFNRDEHIQLQIGVLNVISNIAKNQTQVSPHKGQPTPVVQQPAPYYQQPYNVPGTSQLQYVTHQHPTSYYQPPTVPYTTSQTNLFPIPQTPVTNFPRTATSIPEERINVRQFVENFISVEDNPERSSSANTDTSSLDMDLYPM